METTPNPEFDDLLATLLERRELSQDQVRWFLQEVMAGRCPEVEAAAVLIALGMKGETAAEIAAAAEVLREHMVGFDPGRPDVIDTCGTGGKAVRTFNISTAAALVVAGADTPVVKHGNRSASSLSGSADVLAALGVAVEGDPAQARRCLEGAGLAFCYAPRFHPALCHIAPLRRRLRVRTLFNWLGPLANPGRAPFQLLGVGRPELLDPLAGALARLGVRRAFLVSSRDGLDEVSLSAPTRVREVRGNQVREWEWTPGDFGLAPCSLSDLRAGGPGESAAVIRGVLAGQEGPATRIVLANAAAALVAAERATTLAEGVARAAESLATGRAARVLERLITCSRENGPAGGTG
jgi:anthranilate phosphoribosyltransferase